MDQRAPFPFSAKQVAAMMGGTASGNNVLCPGPGHSAKDKSLSITIDPRAPDGFICKSHANDSWQDCKDYIFGRLGLPKWRPDDSRPFDNLRRKAEQRRKPVDDLPPEREEPFYDAHLIRKGFAPTVVYPYEDAEGRLLYEVLRYDHPEEGKTFLARRPSGNGSWLKGAPTRRVLYRARDREKYAHTTAFVTEGEKDADRLASLGMLGVTVAFGKWSEESIQALAGYECFILEDNDEPGRKKAAAAADFLQGIAASVRIVRLPGLADKGDVSDWLDAGGTPEKLLEIARGGDTGATIKATPFKWMAPEALPPRQWIYGRHFVRKFVSTTIAPGGVGKSALEAIEALAITTGRSLLGIRPDERANVWIWNGEDPQDELQRRIIAAMMHYRIEPSEIEGRLFVDSGRDTEICIAEQTRSGTIINAPAVEQITKTIRENNIGLLIIDPFVSSHRVTENDNNAIDRVAKTWAKIGDETGCAIELVHHARKTGGNEVTVEDSRGAVALLGAARSARVLNGMTKEESEKAEIENHRLYFRVENGKANLTAPSDKASWHHLASVDLGNAQGGRPGDSVGVVTRWEWPDAMDGVTVASLRAAQVLAAAGGPWRENHQAKDWIGRPIAEALNLDPDNKSDKRKILALLKVWMQNEMFIRIMRRDEKRRVDKAFIEVGKWATD